MLAVDAFGVRYAGNSPRPRDTRDALRELTLAVEAMAVHFPLLIKLEDIHRSDASTLDWLAHIARRPEHARLMVLATFRTAADAAAAKVGVGGLVAEPRAASAVEEIALHPLDLKAIEAYVQVRLRNRATQAREMAPVLLERTGGNLLFMTSIVNQLAQQHLVTPDAVGFDPARRARFIDRQIDDLGESDRTPLTAAVSSAANSRPRPPPRAESEVDSVEDACARLARYSIFIVGGSDRVAGWHARRPLLVPARSPYRELLYDRLPATRRALSHARVGRRLEGLEDRLDEIAAELAEHFERGNEPGRATASPTRRRRPSARRSANAEAINHLAAAHSMRSSTSPTMSIAPGSRSSCASRWEPPSSRPGFGAPEVLDATPPRAAPLRSPRRAR